MYIREAHASDEWPLGNQVVIEQHKILQDRLNAAKTLKEMGFNVNMVVDSMENRFNTLFEAWPERYYFFEGHDFRIVSEPMNIFGYDRLGLRTTLAEFANKKIGKLPEDKYPVLSTDPISLY